MTPDTRAIRNSLVRWLIVLCLLQDVFIYAVLRFIIKP